MSQQSIRMALGNGDATTRPARCTPRRGQTTVARASEEEVCELIEALHTTEATSDAASASCGGGSEGPGRDGGVSRGSHGRVRGCPRGRSLAVPFAGWRGSGGTGQHCHLLPPPVADLGLVGLVEVVYHRRLRGGGFW